ncbi:MAG: DoxX-like family protein [Chitinophagales bacterium]
MTKLKVRKILTYCIATVWITNGLFCKILNLVPRHEQIVQEILKLDGYSSSLLTLLIGFSEVIMAIWILLQYKSRFNAVLQMVIVASMNIIEFFSVPNLLLWGKLNSLFAFAFILIVYFNEFYLNKKPLFSEIN